MRRTILEKDGAKWLRSSILSTYVSKCENINFDYFAVIKWISECTKDSPL